MNPHSEPSRDDIFGQNMFSRSLNLDEALKALNPHDHLCLVYETEEEWRAVAIPFIAIGLQRNEKCMYVVDTHTADQVRTLLHKRGIDTAAVEASGQLAILHETEAYTRDGIFDPDKMTKFLIEETQKAVSEGYTALRVTGEASWALRGHPGSELLIEYEAKLNRDFFPYYPCLAICQYNREQFDPKTIRNVIMTHPLMVRENCIYHNPYYITPDEFLSQRRNHYEVKHWLETLEHQSLVAEAIRRSEELEALYAISATISQSIELKEVLRVALEKTLEVLNAEGGAIYLYDESNQTFIPSVHCGLSQHILEEITGLEKGEEIPEQVAQPGGLVVVTNLAEGSGRTSTPAAEGWQSLASVPLKAEGTLKGVLTIVSRVKARFRPKDMSLLSSIGNQIGMAIGNAQLYEASQQELRERIRTEEKLRKSEEQFRRMADSIQDGLTIIEGGKTVYVNDRACKIFGVPREELVELSDLDVAVPEEKERVSNILKETQKTGIPPPEMEFWIVHKDGTRRYIHNRYSLNVENDPKTQYIVTTDMTRHKMAEDAIQKSEEKYRTFVRNPQGIAYRRNMNWAPLFFHGAVEDITGYTEDDFLAGTPRWNQIIHPDDWPSLAESVKNIKTDPYYSTNREYRIIRKDNSIRWVQEFIQNVCDDSQNPVCVQGMIYDITENKKTQEELTQLHTAVRMSTDSIIITDIDGNITDANEAAVSIYRTLRREEVIGRNIMDIVVPEDRKRVSASVEEALQKGYAGNREYDFIAEDGTRITVETNMALIKTAEGTPIGIVSISRDITERKKAEREMKKKLMKYDLKEGTVHLVKEHMPSKSVEAFKDLLTVGYPGLAISRTPKGGFAGRVEEKFRHLWIAEKGGKDSILPDLDEIRQTIEALTKPTAVFIDRLDYLLSKTGFEKILFFIQNLREIAYIKSHVVIISLDHTILKNNELKQIEKETERVEPLYKTKLPEELIEVVKVVYTYNVKGVTPSYAKVGQEIGASKPTTRKRIRSLIGYGYLRESKMGRKKVLTLTEKGKILFLE